MYSSGASSHRRDVAPGGSSWKIRLQALTPVLCCSFPQFSTVSPSSPNLSTITGGVAALHWLRMKSTGHSNDLPPPFLGMQLGLYCATGPQTSKKHSGCCSGSCPTFAVSPSSWHARSFCIVGTTKCPQTPLTRSHVMCPVVPPRPGLWGFSASLM